MSSALLLVLVACSGATEGETTTPDGAEAVVPECERLERPCSWSETDDEVYTASVELLRTVGTRIDEGEPPQDVAEDLAADERVVGVNADEGGVLFRLEGGLPVAALTDATSPYAVGADRLAAEGDAATGQARGPAHGPDVVAAGSDVAPAEHLVLAQAEGGTTYRPSRQPDLRPRRALVLQPFFTADPENWASDQEARTGEPVTPPAPATATFEALEANPHVDAVAVRDRGDPADFLGWDAYDLVVVQSHGWYFTCNFGDESPEPLPGVGERTCGPVVAGGPLAESPTSADVSTLPSKALWEEAGLGTSIAWRDGEFRYAFDNSFFAAVAPRNTIVILNVCRSSVDTGATAAGGATSVPNGLPHLLTAGGASAVFAWDTQIDAYQADETSRTLVEMLAGHAVETSVAFEELERGDLAQMDVQGSRARLEHFGANLRARDAVQVEDRGAEMMPGAVIAVDGRPDDGQTDRIRSLTIRVDGVADPTAVLSWELPVRHDGPRRMCLNFPVAGSGTGSCPDAEPATGVTYQRALPSGAAGAVTPGGRWDDFLVTFTNLDLEFDLEEDDLICCREHTLVVEIGDGNEVSRHEISPVFLRREIVEVLDPDLGQPIASEDRIALDGRAGDGIPETYPLVVRMEHIDEATLDDLLLEVTISGPDIPTRTIEAEGPAWDEVDDGTYRLERDVLLDDFEDQEEEATIEATLTSSERGELGRYVADPVILELQILDGCGLLSSVEVTEALGRPFGNPVGFQGSTCLWNTDDETSQFQLSVFGGASEFVESASPESFVDGIGDAALYDTANADSPSGIEIDGVMHYNNFVNLHVALGDTLVVLHPQGNIVVEDGTEALLGKMADLVEILETRL